MSDHIGSSLTDSAGAHRGQSLVEFALVLPMLLVLLLGLADFGRVFHAGITVEAAARNAAETTAQEYLQLIREKAGGTLNSADYADLHALAVRQACNELGVLPNAKATDGTCQVSVAVCIHDSAPANPSCGGATTAVCDGFASGLGTAQNPSSNGLPYVEVRACYGFTTLAGNIVVALPFGSSINLGDIPLLRARTFTVADY